MPSKDDNKVKRVPCNLEAEEALLGSILIDDEVSNDMVPIVSSKFFYSKNNQTIFEAMYALYQNGKPIDIVSVIDKLDATGKLADAGGTEYITKLVEIPSAANAKYYFEAVSRDYLLRRIIHAGRDISDKGYTSEDGSDALRFSEKAIFDISEETDRSSLVHVASASGAVVDMIENVQKGIKEEVGISSGYDNLDFYIGGFRPGTFNLIAARPGVGKTALALSIAAHAAIKDKKSVAIFNLEMSMKELVGRMLTQISGVPFSGQQRPFALAPSQMRSLYDAHRQLCSAQLYVDDSAENTPMNILSKCRRMKATNGLDLVIVDYLQLMTMASSNDIGSRSSSDMSRQQEVSNISRYMKVFAKELQVPMLVLCQLNRAGELRGGGEPKLSDLRESGSIEQDADLVMFLQYYKPVDESGKPVQSVYGDKDVLELYIKKNRHGSPGKVAYEWTGDLLKFQPIEPLDAAQYAPERKGVGDGTSTLNAAEVADKLAKMADKGPVKISDVSIPFPTDAPPVIIEPTAVSEVAEAPVDDIAEITIVSDEDGDMPF